VPKKPPRALAPSASREPPKAPIAALRAASAARRASSGLSVRAASRAWSVAPWAALAVVPGSTVRAPTKLPSVPRIARCREIHHAAGRHRYRRDNLKGKPRIHSAFGNQERHLFTSRAGDIEPLTLTVLRSMQPSFARPADALGPAKRA
jgi:hypothetical protein